jgi:hypothetical protein
MQEYNEPVFWGFLAVIIKSYGIERFEVIIPECQGAFIVIDCNTIKAYSMEVSQRLNGEI